MQVNARGSTLLCGCSWRSEEHTSELQSQSHLVCRLLLEKKNRFTPLDITPFNLSKTEASPLPTPVVVIRRSKGALWPRCAADTIIRLFESVAFALSLCPS